MLLLTLSPSLPLFIALFALGGQGGDWLRQRLPSLQSGSGRARPGDTPPAPPFPTDVAVSFPQWSKGMLSPSTKTHSRCVTSHSARTRRSCMNPHQPCRRPAPPSGRPPEAPPWGSRPPGLCRGHYLPPPPAVGSQMPTQGEVHPSRKPFFPPRTPPPPWISPLFAGTSPPFPDFPPFLGSPFFCWLKQSARTPKTR